MLYTVAWKKLHGKEVIKEERYANLKEALESAARVTMTRPVDLEISVTDETGREHFTRVVQTV